MGEKPWSRGHLPRGHTRMQWANADHVGPGKFHVPAKIAKLIDPDAVFRIELNDDGVLYRYVEGQRDRRETLPHWMRG